MKADELAEAMTELGFDPHTLAGQEAFGALFGADEDGWHSVRTVRKWIQAERGIPPGVATTVVLMLMRHISPAMVENAHRAYQEGLRRRRHRARPEARAYA